MAARGSAVAHALHHAISSVDDRLLAVSALLRASPSLTLEQFGRFVADVGRLPGLRAVAYIAATDRADLGTVISRGRQTHGSFDPFDLDENMEPIPLGDRARYHIVLFVEPLAEFEGFVGADASTVPALREAIDRVVFQNANSATAPFSQQDGTPGSFLIFQPVYGATPGLDGFVAGVVDLDVLLAARLDPMIAGGITWEVSDVTDDDARTPYLGTAQWTTSVDLDGRSWLVGVTPAAGAGGWSVEQTMVVVVGLIGSVVAAALAFTLRQRADAESLRLAALTEGKDHFLASVSHELRTPLTAVIGFLGELHDHWEALEPEEREELVAVAGDEAAEMAALVEDLLVDARLGTANPLRLATARVDVVGEARDVVARLSRARGKDVAVTGSGVLVGDEIRVRQILRNLVDNALKHGAAPVEVAVAVDGEWCTVTVHDSGSGVPECCREDVFRPGTSAADHGHPVVTDSNRLGLPVSAYLAGLMGGSLVFDPDRSAFVLTIPRHSPVEHGDDLSTVALVAAPMGR